MGRFYKTAKPEMMDFMFKVPEQAIMTAIKGADAQLEGQESYLTDLQKQLKTAALDPDEEKRKTKVTELEKKISEHSLKIFENPLAAIKEQKGIRDLGQEIYKDLTEGELYAYNTNAQRRASYQEEQMKRATQKDGSIRVQDVDKAMAIYDLQYRVNEGAQFNKQTGKFNPYGTQNIVNYFDNMKYAEEIASKMRTHKDKSWQATKEGSYWFKTTTANEILGLDEGTAGTYSMMVNNKDLTDRVNYDIRTEALSRALNENRMKDIDLIEDEIRTDYYGERDKTTKELILVPVLNEDGTQKKEKVTVKDANGKEKVIEKPVMQPKKEGKLLQQARAAADLYDIHDTEGGKDMTGQDAFDLAAFNSNLRKQEEEFKKNLDAPVVIDVFSNEVSEGILAGKTHEEVEKNLTDQKTMLDSQLHNTKSQILQSLSLSDKITDPNQYDKIEKDITVFLQSTEGPDWKGLDNYLKTTLVNGMSLSGITGTDNITVGTLTKGFQDKYIQANVQYENQKNYYDKLINDADKQLRPELTTKGMSNLSAQISEDEQEVKDIETLISNYEKDPFPGRYSANFNIEVEKKKLITLKDDIQRRKATLVTNKQLRNIALDNVVNFNANTPDSKNNLNKKILSMGGNAFRSYGASDTEVKRFNAALNQMKKDSYKMLAEATKAKQIVNGKPVDFNLNELISETLLGKDLVSQETDEEGNLIIKTKDASYTLEILSVGLSRDDIQGIGQSPWHYKLRATNPQTKKQEIIDVYQPYENVQTNEATILVDRYKADMDYENFLNRAQAFPIPIKDTNSNLNGRVTYLPASNEVLFEYNNGSTEKVALTTPEGAAAAKAAYKKIYKAPRNY
jgi:hypothetical protein